VVDVVTDLDDTDRSIGSESGQAPASAKVLKLPTSSH